MIVEAFHVKHLDEMRVNAYQRASFDRYCNDDDRARMQTGFARTVRIDGKIMMVGGVLELYDDTSIGHLWSLLADGADQHALALHRCLLRLFQITGKRMLVATTECDYAYGCRWLGMLGFDRQAETLEAYGPDGADHYLYVRSG